MTFDLCSPRLLVCVLGGHQEAYESIVELGAEHAEDSQSLLTSGLSFAYTLLIASEWSFVAIGVPPASAGSGKIPHQRVHHPGEVPTVFSEVPE